MGTLRDVTTSNTELGTQKDVTNSSKSYLDQKVKKGVGDSKRHHLLSRKGFDQKAGTESEVIQPRHRYFKLLSQLR
jgi:hypothetical protein